MGYALKTPDVGDALLLHIDASGRYAQDWIYARHYVETAGWLHGTRFAVSN
jgi:hypothetical protein